MCGIVAYTGRKRAAPVLLDGLKRLEYRGYDSAGIAVCDGGRLSVVKKQGRVKALAAAASLDGCTGIGHTRWATHGAPCERNAHPHVFQSVGIVHNGIIENAARLRAACEARGETFLSETDSETIAHLVAYALKTEEDLLQAVRAACGQLEGSWAIAVLCSDRPGEIVCARMKSPLIAAKGKDGLYAASDAAAIAGDGRILYAAEDGEFIRLKDGEISFWDAEGNAVAKRPFDFDAQPIFSARGKYRHYMQKEMAEIPQAIERSLVDLTESRYQPLYKVLCQTKYIHIVACGTAYHSGLCAKIAFEMLARLPTEVTVASEYRYCDPIYLPGTLVIAVSQSGETADTLAAASLARGQGVPVLAVTNVAWSSLCAIADHCILTGAGQEIAVAATKSFNAQLAALYSLAAALAQIGGRGVPSLAQLAALSRGALEAAESVRVWAPFFPASRSVFFLGRGADRCAALEGSLKLKEISYLPGEGYAAGELKHGTLALVGPDTPVVAIITQRALAEKTMNAVHEVAARGAYVFLVTSLQEYASAPEVSAAVCIPACEEVFSPILSVIPLQELAYRVALACGNDPDKPRNLAKSVTVE